MIDLDMCEIIAERMMAKDEEIARLKKRIKELEDALDEALFRNPGSRYLRR